MITKTITLYTFDELSDRAKETARDWYRRGSGPEDFEFVIEDAETILGMLGVSLRYHDVKLMGGGTRRDPNIWWQLGYMQSDGACFEGTYTYAKGAHLKIRKHAPQDQELHRIADALLEIQKRNRYGLQADVQNRQHLWADVEVTQTLHTAYEVRGDDTVALIELMKDLCRWIYQQLRTEDEYRSADAQVDENIRANEYTFTEDGEREDA